MTFNAESNPADHTVAEVVSYLSTADPSEAARVKGLEADGKARVGILEAETAPGPTDPSPATLATLNGGEAPEEDDVTPTEPTGPQVGDVLEDTEDGYGRVVVSADGLPTDATVEADAQETPPLV